MANVKITELPAAVALSGGEICPIVQSGVTRKLSIGTATQTESNQNTRTIDDVTFNKITVTVDAVTQQITVTTGADTTTNFNVDYPDITTAAANFQIFAATNTSGARTFNIFQGDGTANVNFSVDAATGNTTIGGTANITGLTTADEINAKSISFDSGTNLLDTYEEGTWTPSYQAASGSPTWTYSVQAGEYIRIGRMVFATFRISTTAFTAAGTQKVRIAGWPFAAKNTASLNFSGVLSLTQGFTATTNPRVLSFLENTSLCEMTINSSNDPRNELDVTLNEAGMQNGANNIVGSIAYIAA